MTPLVTILSLLVKQKNNRETFSLNLRRRSYLIQYSRFYNLMSVGGVRVKVQALLLTYTATSTHGTFLVH